MKKKKSGFAKFLSVIGTILLVIIILAGALYLSLRFWKIPLDDAAALRSIPSTGSENHLSFTSDADMTISFDKNDIWYFICSKYGDDYLADLNDNLSSYNLEIKRCGFELQDNGITAGAEAFYNGWLRIPVKINASVGCSDGEILLSPEKVSIGPLKLPIGTIKKFAGNDSDSLSYVYGPENVFMDSVREVSVSDGKLNIKGAMSSSYLTPDTALFGKCGIYSVFTKCGNLIGPVLLNNCSDPKVTFSTILPKIVDDPSVFIDTLNQYFTIDNPSLKEFEKKNYGMLLRWYPEYSIEAFKEAWPAANDEYYLVEHTLTGMSEFMSNAHSKKQFRITDGELTYKKAPYDPEICFGDSFSTYSQVFDLDASSFCFMKKEIGIFPRLSEIANSDVNLSISADMDSMCAIGLLKKGADGKDYAVIFPDVDKWNFYPLDDVQYSSQIFYPSI